MRHSFTALLLSLCIAATGCAKEDASAPETEATDTMTKTTQDSPKQLEDAKSAVAAPVAPPKTIGTLTPADKARLEDTIASSFGKGSFEDSSGANYTFTLEGSVLSDKSGYGRFRFYSFKDDGKMDVKGEMSCVHIDSAERRIWLAGRITENSSTDEKYRGGPYATGSYLQFRARPNSMDGQNPAAIEVPSFVDQATAEAFCGKGEWSEDTLYELGEHDLIAAIP